MPMARNLKDKQSVVRSKQYMNMCNYDKALAMLTIESLCGIISLIMVSSETDKDACKLTWRQKTP